VPVPDAVAAIRLLAQSATDAALVDSAVPPARADEFLRFWHADPARAALPLVFATPVLSTPVPDFMPSGACRSDRTPAAVARALIDDSPLLLDPIRRELSANDVQIRLTPSETALLGHLCRVGRPVPADELSRIALGYVPVSHSGAADFPPDTAATAGVRTHLSNLRRKCVDIGWPDPVVAHRGFGYEAVGVRLQSGTQI